MEQVIDKLISEMELLKETDEFMSVFDIQTDVKFDDPGIVMVGEYPYIYVTPITEEPKTATVGLAGYDVSLLTLQIGMVINAADYFDPSVSEMPGSRELVRSVSLIRKRLRRLSKRKLDGLEGVRDMVVLSTNYVPDLRDNVFVRVAATTVTVERQYQHEE